MARALLALSPLFSSSLRSVMMYASKSDFSFSELAGLPISCCKRLISVWSRPFRSEVFPRLDSMSSRIVLKSCSFLWVWLNVAFATSFTFWVGLAAVFSKGTTWSSSDTFR